MRGLRAVTWIEWKEVISAYGRVNRQDACRLWFIARFVSYAAVAVVDGRPDGHVLPSSMTLA